MHDLIAASAAHAPAMAALHALAFPPAECWPASAFAEQLTMPGIFGWIAARDDGAEGFVLARVAADESEILTLAVPPTSRRRGVAAALLARAMRQAAEAGALVMLLEVAESNEAARALYARFGFTEVGRRRRYYAGGIDALVLRRDLGLAQPE